MAKLKYVGFGTRMIERADVKRHNLTLSEPIKVSSNEIIDVDDEVADWLLSDASTEKANWQRVNINGSDVEDEVTHTASVSSLDDGDADQGSNPDSPTKPEGKVKK